MILNKLNSHDLYRSFWLLLLFFLFIYFRTGEANWRGWYPTYYFGNLLGTTICGVGYGFCLAYLHQHHGLTRKMLIGRLIFFALLMSIYHIVRTICRVGGFFKYDMFCFEAQYNIWVPLLPVLVLQGSYLIFGWKLQKHYSDQHWLRYWGCAFFGFYILTAYFLDYIHFWDVWVGIETINVNGYLVRYRYSLISLLLCLWEWLIS